jgi:hypothetical protein
VSLFEEYLARGQWLAESERLALYKYLLKTRIQKYRMDSDSLLKNKSYKSSTANGEIKYSINSNIVEYKVRQIGETDWTEQIRTLKLSPVKPLLRRSLCRFFAQAELDMLRNSPLREKGEFDKKSFTINEYPYYTLNYYSNGSGKVKGFFKKVSSQDDPLLSRLLAS